MVKKEDQDISYINPFRRGAAAAIDMMVVGVIRVTFAQVIGMFFINQALIDFHLEFKEKFGVGFSSINPEHVAFLSSHTIVSLMSLFMISIILVGALYHAFLNSSTWSATLGKRVCNIILVDDKGKSMTFWQSLTHYFLSLVPWIFMIYILLYQAKTRVTLYDALTANTTNLVLGLITVFWVQIHIFTKKKNTVHDMIMGCSMVKGKIGYGFPKRRKK